MKWIGLTGGLASGKSTVARALSAKGFHILDADLIARQVVMKGTLGLQSVVREFGSDFLLASGDLDRSKLAQEVFFDASKRKKLQDITHPLIRFEVKKRRQELENSGEKIAIYDIPLLFETKAEKQFDAILLVTCSRETQIRRLRDRNHWSESEIEARLSSQIPLREKESLADFIIRNEGSWEDLENEIRRAQGWLMKL